ncbi:MAG: histidinol-phosphate transaminase [Candidatus Hydrothermarchaeales archaeon]
MALRIQLQKRVHGGDVWDYFPVIDFSSNVNPLGPPKSAVEAIKKELWRIGYYPDPDGKEMKAVLSRHLGLEPENITLGNGSTELIKNFCEAFLRKEDEVLILEPTFSEYGLWSEAEGAIIKRVYGGKERDFEVSHKDIEFGDNTRAVFLCNPNNPTGKTIKGLDAIMKEALERGILLFLDEAYIEFTDLESASSKIRGYPNLFVLRSMTKFYSLPGLRIGYGVADEELIAKMEGVRVPWNVNALAQVALLKLLQDDDFARKSREFIRMERDLLYDELSRLELKVYCSEANFLLFNLRHFEVTAAELRKKLIDKGILIRDCASFHGLDEYHARISVRSREENFILLGELKKVLK